MWVEVVIATVLVVLAGIAVNLVTGSDPVPREVVDKTIGEEDELDEETKRLLSRVKPMGGVRKRPRPPSGRGRRQRRVQRTRQQVRRARNALYTQLAGGNARVARALRITGGDLPESCAGFGRLTKWGKNHHLRPDAPRTFCGKDAEEAQPANWDRGWCVQCDDVAAAVEEKSAIESRRGGVA